MRNGIPINYIMSLNSERFLQFRPTSYWWPMLIIVLLKFAKTSFLFFSPAELVKILVQPRPGLHRQSFFFLSQQQLSKWSYE
jgi:hypothetical protein